jgi:hypothetical protein
MVKGFKIIDLNEAILRNALDDSKFRDYEDSIQYQSADLECDAIITRNKKDFPHKKPKVLTPEEFLNSYKL